MRDDAERILLVVVRREKVIFGGDVGFEEAPRFQRNAPQVLSVGARKRGDQPVRLAP